jgi:hypothetical protein
VNDIRNSADQAAVATATKQQDLLPAPVTQWWRLTPATSFDVVALLEMRASLRRSTRFRHPVQLVQREVARCILRGSQAAKSRHARGRRAIEPDGVDQAAPASRVRRPSSTSGRLRMPTGLSRSTPSIRMR